MREDGLDATNQPNKNLRGLRHLDKTGNLTDLTNAKPDPPTKNYNPQQQTNPTDTKNRFF